MRADTRARILAAQRIEAIQAEMRAKARSPAEQRRFMDLLLAQMARDFARGELLLCEDQLNRARAAVENPKAPPIDVADIPTPREARARDQAERLQAIAKARARYGAFGLSPFKAPKPKRKPKIKRKKRKH